MRKKFEFLGVLALVLLLVFPTRANAIDFMPKGVFYQGDVGNGNYGAVVAAYNQYDAACYVLGKNPDSISATIKQKLSDPSFGGRFYEYAQSFFTQSGALEDVPAWVPTYIVWGSELMDLVLTDYQSVWYSTATKTLHDDALEDFVRILNGEDLGGGGSVPDVSNGLDIPFTWGSDNVIFSSKMHNQAAFRAASGSATLRLTPSQASNVCSYQYAVVGLFLANPGIYGTPSNSTFVFSVFGTNNPSPSVSQNGSGMAGVSAAGGKRFDYGNNNASKTLSAYNGGVFTATSQFSSSFISGWMLYYSVIPVSDFSPEPDGDWPDPAPTPTPTAPELPEPATPTVETPVSPTVPAPVWPDIIINIEPEPTPDSTPSGLDYTELLTRINDNLISIDSFARAINSNLNSLRSDLLAEFNGVIGSLRNIYNYLLTIDSVLETHCTHLRNKIEESAVFIANYMRTLIRWLADQLDYDDTYGTDSFDDSLLITINDKLGGGTYEPNPIKDEQGYYQWLDDLWDRFLLGDNWQSSMGSISGSFNELKTRFPFSIPWDVVALFRLFVHDPVTPVFDLPLYFSSDGSTPVHVDLTPWDSVAAVVRPLVFVIFALKLALLSRDLLGGLGADKGGL